MIVCVPILPTRYEVTLRDTFTGREYSSIVWARSAEAATRRLAQQVDYENKIGILGAPTTARRIGFRRRH